MMLTPSSQQLMAAALATTTTTSAAAATPVTATTTWPAEEVLLWSRVASGLDAGDDDVYTAATAADAEQQGPPRPLPEGDRGNDVDTPEAATMCASKTGDATFDVTAEDVGTPEANAAGSVFAPGAAEATAAAAAATTTLSRPPPPATTTTARTDFATPQHGTFNNVARGVVAGDAVRKDEHDAAARNTDDGDDGEASCCPICHAPPREAVAPPCREGQKEYSTV